MSERIALVTGANKGIGLEIARGLGREGLHVVIGARDLGRGEDAAAALRAEGMDAATVQLDVSDPASPGRPPPSSRRAMAAWTCW